MPSPTLTFAFILATLLGAIFHFIFGGNARRLAIFLLASWVGFGLGQVIGVTFGIDVFTIGTLHIVAAVFGSLLALIVAFLLTSQRTRKRSIRSKG